MLAVADTSREKQRLLHRTRSARLETYANQVHGFCFSYPPIYLHNPLPSFANEYVRRTTQKSRLLALQDRRFWNSGVLVLYDDVPFDLQSFSNYRPDVHDPYWGAPMGIDKPPGEIKRERIPFTSTVPAAEVCAIRTCTTST